MQHNQVLLEKIDQVRDTITRVSEHAIDKIGRIEVWIEEKEKNIERFYAHDFHEVREDIAELKKYKAEKEALEALRDILLEHQRVLDAIELESDRAKTSKRVYIAIALFISQALLTIAAEIIKSIV